MNTITHLPTALHSNTNPSLSHPKKISICNLSYARTYMCTQVAAEVQGGGAAGVCRFAVEVGATFCRYISASCMLTATLAGTFAFMLVQVTCWLLRLHVCSCSLQATSCANIHANMQTYQPTCNLHQRKCKRTCQHATSTNVHANVAVNMQPALAYMQNGATTSTVNQPTPAAPPP